MKSSVFKKKLLKPEKNGRAQIQQEVKVKKSSSKKHRRRTPSYRIKTKWNEKKTLKVCSNLVLTIIINVRHSIFSFLFFELADFFLSFLHSNRSTRCSNNDIHLFYLILSDRRLFDAWAAAITFVVVVAICLWRFSYLFFCIRNKSKQDSFFLHIMPLKKKENENTFLFLPFANPRIA